MAGPVFVMATLSFALGILLKRAKNKGIKIFVITGLIFIIAGQGLFLLLKGMWPKFASLVLLGAGVGLVMTPVNTLVTGSCSTKRRGIITCLYGSLRFFGVAIGPPLYGLSETYGILPTVANEHSADYFPCCFNCIYKSKQNNGAGRCSKSKLGFCS